MHFETIDGETPLEDLSGLVPDYITTRDELNIAEMKNISLANSKYLLKPVFKYSQNFLLNIHFDMFSNVWRWAGKTRKTNLNIGVDFLYIDIEIRKLLDDLIFWEQETKPAIETITFFHHRLVKIHPFINGNGRWARLVSKIYAKTQYQLNLKWPESEYVKQSDYRKRYLFALRKADTLDYSDLIQLHKVCIQS